MQPQGFSQMNRGSPKTGSKIPKILEMMARRSVALCTPKGNYSGFVPIPIRLVGCLLVVDDEG